MLPLSQRISKFIDSLVESKSVNSRELHTKGIQVEQDYPAKQCVPAFHMLPIYKLVWTWYGPDGVKQCSGSPQKLNQAHFRELHNAILLQRNTCSKTEVQAKQAQTDNLMIL